ncbi:class I SAM-dependent methyltransferase [Bacillus sp. Marseille-P3661]|uniref:class I SAM-dependent methyltransferase n=1 Tax=Bacillus sp. Marseille-P3661 TaxID=1936234 RepID=UPI000C853A8B|nr:methyltransferase domain-containing protein [Bacillus sp. Marseille-P3661]
MDPRKKWNNKYRERITNHEQPAANERLKTISPYLTGGDALDVACGLGVNSTFLAKLDFRVDALDISDVAIDYLKKLADKEKLTIYPRLCDLTDLNNLHLKEKSYDLVVITYYLDRNLLQYIKTVIKDNGYFFMETFYKSPLQEKEGISNQFKLQPGELLSLYKEMQILYYEENEHEGRQTIFVRKKT